MLSDVKCRNARARNGRDEKLPDGRGLYLWVKQSGSKKWLYRFELPVAGKRKESSFVIGDYATAPNGETEEQASVRRKGEQFTLSEAREERAKARALIVQGINPADHRKQQRARRQAEQANTFELVAAEWLRLRDWERVTKDRRQDMLKRVVYPHIGAQPISDIIPAQILEVLQTAARNNGPTVAAEARRSMSGIFDFAVATLRATSNPVYPVRNALPSNKTQHKRPLTPEEIGEFLVALEDYENNFQTVAAFRLLWLTLCRPSEVVQARWEEFELAKAVWIIPAERMKKRRAHTVPLPRQAVDILKGLQGANGTRPHVFPHRKNRAEAMTDAALRQAISTMGWSGRYSPHATRTTGSTRLNELGFNSDWIERQLAHVEQNVVRRTYNHAEYLAERTIMMQQWADHLDQWLEQAREYQKKKAS